VKNRVHLDLRAADIDEETARLVELGATELARLEGWVTPADRKATSSTCCPCDEFSGATGS
jgi:hypothetical protein